MEGGWRWDLSAREEERTVCALRRKARRRRFKRPVLDFCSGMGITVGEGAVALAVGGGRRSVRVREEASSSAESERTTFADDVMAVGLGESPRCEEGGELGLWGVFVVVCCEDAGWKICGVVDMGESVVGG